MPATIQNDAFQTYDEYVDVSGRGVRITKVHVCPKNMPVFFTSSSEAAYAKSAANFVVAFNAPRTISTRRARRITST